MKSTATSNVIQPQELETISTGTKSPQSQMQQLKLKAEFFSVRSMAGMLCSMVSCSKNDLFVHFWPATPLSTNLKHDTHNILPPITSTVCILKLSPPFLFFFGSAALSPLREGRQPAGGRGSGAVRIAPPCRAMTMRWRSSRKPGPCWHGRKMPCNMQYRQNSKRVLSWGELKCWKNWWWNGKGKIIGFFWVGCTEFFWWGFGSLSGFFLLFAENLLHLLMNEISLTPIRGYFISLWIHYIDLDAFFIIPGGEQYCSAISSCSVRIHPKLFSDGNWRRILKHNCYLRGEGFARFQYVIWSQMSGSKPAPEKFVSPVRHFDEFWSINFY